MFNAHQQHVQRMIEAPVRRLILKLAVPTMIGMLMTSFYNMADAWFLGRLNTESVAAVGIAFPAMALLQAIAFFFGHGSGNTMSRMLGAKAFTGARQMVATGCMGAFICGGCIALLGLVFAPWIARSLGAPIALQATATSYLRIVLLGAPWMCASLAINNLLRFQGRAFFAMVGILLGGVLNVILDPCFIFLLDWGIYGAAWATLLSQAVAFCLLFALLQRQGIVPFSWRSIALRISVWKEIVRGGMPSLFRQGLGAIAFAALNHAAGSYGATAGIAAMSIVTRIVMIIYGIAIGLGQGFQPVCGFSYGAQKYRRVYEAFIFLVGCSGLFFFVTMGVGCYYAEFLIATVRPDYEVVQIGAQALRWQMATLLLSAWIIPCNMLTQTIGKGKIAAILAAARQGLFFLPCIVLLPFLLGLQGVIIAQACADVCAFCLTLCLSLSLVRRLRKNSV